MKRWRHYNKELAIVLAAFGSVAERKRYENFKNYIQESFKDIPIFMAFSARTVLKKLNAESTQYQNLIQLLADLDMEGYKRIVISSINIFPTDEHELNKKVVEGYQQFVPSYLRITGSLFSKTEYATSILYELNKKLREHYQDDILLYLIHGAPYFEQAGLQAIGYCKDFLKELHPHNFFTALERIYLFDYMKDSLISQIKSLEASQNKKMNIRLVPILLASGNHFEHDVATIFESLNKEFTVSIAESMSGSDKFNLLDLEFVRECFKKDIEIEIKKFG